MTACIMSMLMILTGLKLFMVYLELVILAVH